MKILHVCDSIIGGTGTYLTELLPGQVPIYGEGNVVLLMPRNHEKYVEPALRDSGVRFAYFSRPNRLRGLLHLTQIYRKLAKVERPDIVHTHSWGAGFIARSLPRPRGAKIIFCAHGWAFDIVSVKPWLRRILAMLERALAYRADHIIAISRHEYQRGLEVGIPEHRMSVVLNSIARQPPQVEAEAWDDPRLKILFAGRFDRQKGLDVLLRAVEPLEDEVTVRAIGEAVVSGSGSSSYRVDYPHVSYLGWRDRNGVAAQMLASDVLVVPSRWEGFGLIALEAMRVSLPVAASAVGGLQEILDGGEHGFLFPADDVEGLRNCLRTITREKLELMAEKGHRRFLDHYRPGEMAHQMESIYTGVRGGTSVAVDANAASESKSIVV